MSTKVAPSRLTISLNELHLLLSNLAVASFERIWQILNEGGIMVELNQMDLKYV
jgi:hypothetical protein